MSNSDSLVSAPTLPVITYKFAKGFQPGAFATATPCQNLSTSHKDPYPARNSYSNINIWATPQFEISNFVSKIKN